MTRAEEIKVLLTHQFEELRRVSSYFKPDAITRGRTTDHLLSMNYLCKSITDLRAEFTLEINKPKN